MTGTGILKTRRNKSKVKLKILGTFVLLKSVRDLLGYKKITKFLLVFQPFYFLWYWSYRRTVNTNAVDNFVLSKMGYSILLHNFLLKKFVYIVIWKWQFV